MHKQPSNTLFFLLYRAKSLDTGRPEQAQRLKPYDPSKKVNIKKTSSRRKDCLRLYWNTYKPYVYLSFIIVIFKYYKYEIK